MLNFALVVDSHSNYSDLWPMYFGQLNKNFDMPLKKYLFCDKKLDSEKYDVEPIIYDNSLSYRNQILQSLKQVKEEYIIYNSEDYILYDKVKVTSLLGSILALKIDQKYSFVKLIKGPENTIPYGDHVFLKEIDPNDNNFFAQQASIWRTQSFIDVFEASPSENGRMQQEPGGSVICRKLKLRGLQFFNPESQKRGICHWDSWIYPYIATAVCKGKWNTLEYKKELTPLFKEYNIDPKIRGII